MKLIKVEILCEAFYNSFDPGACLLPCGQYKLFFKDGSSQVQSYVMNRDLKEANIVSKVLEFSE